MSNRAFRAARAADTAFSVIELLVVIAIVALLVAILVPTLERARHAAQVAACASNLHQNGAAHFAYQADFKGYFPDFGGKKRWRKPCKMYTGGSERGWLSKMQPTGAGTLYLEQYMTVGTRSYEAQAPVRCPTVDWADFEGWPEPVPYNGRDVLFHTRVMPLDGDHVNGGYAFYTGRALHNTCQYWRTDDGWNTKARRNDPRELLMTHQVTLNVGWNNTKHGKTATTSVPWFNPHEGRRALEEPTGTFHQLAADGAVLAAPFAETRNTVKFGGWRGRYRAVAKRAGPTNTTARNGPYFAVER